MLRTWCYHRLTLCTLVVFLVGVHAAANDGPSLARLTIPCSGLEPSLLRDGIACQIRDQGDPIAMSAGSLGLGAASRASLLARSVVERATWERSAVFVPLVSSFRELSYRIGFSVERPDSDRREPRPGATRSFPSRQGQ